MDDYLSQLTLGSSYEVNIDSDIILKWWAWATREEVLNRLRSTDAFQASDGLSKLHENPIVLEFTDGVNPSFVLEEQYRYLRTPTQV